jgi:hypothetical protein
VSLSWSKTRCWHDCIYGTWQMIVVIDQSVSRPPAKVHFHAAVRSSAAAGFNVQNQVICAGRAMQADCEARRFAREPFSGWSSIAPSGDSAGTKVPFSQWDRGRSSVYRAG